MDGVRTELNDVVCIIVISNIDGFTLGSCVCRGIEFCYSAVLLIDAIAVAVGVCRGRPVVVGADQRALHRRRQMKPFSGIALDSHEHLVLLGQDGVGDVGGTNYDAIMHIAEVYIPAASDKETAASGLIGGHVLFSEVNITIGSAIEVPHVVGCHNAPVGIDEIGVEQLICILRAKAHIVTVTETSSGKVGAHIRAGGSCIIIQR